MKYLIPAILLLASCTIPETHQGTVHEITNHTVTIRGSYSLYSGLAVPTRAMRVQAEEICPGAEYISATPWDYTYGIGIHAVQSMQQLYLFRCP